MNNIPIWLLHCPLLSVNLNVTLKTTSSQTRVKFPNEKPIKCNILTKDIKIVLLLKNSALGPGTWEEGSIPISTTHFLCDIEQVTLGWLCKCAQQLLLMIRLPKCWNLLKIWLFILLLNRIRDLLKSGPSWGAALFWKASPKSVYASISLLPLSALFCFIKRMRNSWHTQQFKSERGYINVELL